MAELDAIVVGAGAGGGMAACLLAKRGWKVALLEKGRNPFPGLGDDDFHGSTLGNDEIRVRRNYAMHDPFSEPRVYRDGATNVTTIGRVQPLGVAVGGGTLQYDGDSPRLQRQDFRARATYGDVEGATLADWPLSYEDLAPFYDVAEQWAGIQGLAGADPFAEARGPYPMPPGFPSRGGLLLTDAARRLGYHPHPMPMAINSVFYRGRPACVNCGFRFAGCPVNAKGSSAVTVIRDALRTGNLTLLDNCCVTSVQTDTAGLHATGVRYLDPEGRMQTLTARHVVLGLNAIETARLLLLSANAAHPQGLGNTSGLVGRNLMFHTIFAVIGVFSFDVLSYRGRPLTHAMGDFTSTGGAVNGLRGGYVELGGQIHPVDEGTHYPWLLHNSLMLNGRYRKRIAGASMIGEDMPQADNRVELDPSVKDIYGLPVARITYKRHARDQRLVDTYMPRLEQIVREAGAIEALRRDFAVDDGIPDTKHLLGTARMGTDPARSVTDPWGRLHGVDNVWIADGAVWPTSACFNPTLTQQALALRTAAYMTDPGNPRP